MKIDLNFLLSGEDYIPQVGCAYEIAPGVWGTLNPPTVDLRAEVFALAESEEPSDLVIMQKVLSGLPEDLDAGLLIDGLPAKVAQDFFSLILLAMQRLATSSAGSEQKVAEVVASQQ